MSMPRASELISTKSLLCSKEEEFTEHLPEKAATLQLGLIGDSSARHFHLSVATFRP